MSQLDLSLKPKMIELTESQIAAPCSWRKAVIMTADLGGLADKKAADAMGFKQQEMWSRLKTDLRTGINPDRIEHFMDECKNELLLFNLAYRRGYSLVERETETQRQLRIEREHSRALEDENRILRSCIGPQALMKFAA